MDLEEQLPPILALGQLHLQAVAMKPLVPQSSSAGVSCFPFMDG